MLQNLESSQRLGEGVCSLQIGRNILDREDSRSDSVPKPEMPKVQVFHAPMVLWVLGNSDGGLVVDKKRSGGGGEVIAKLREEIPSP